MTHDHIFNNYKLIIFAILEPKSLFLHHLNTVQTLTKKYRKIKTVSFFRRWIWFIELLYYVTIWRNSRL